MDAVASLVADEGSVAVLTLDDAVASIRGGDNATATMLELVVEGSLVGTPETEATLHA